jgi:integrase
MAFTSKKKKPTRAKGEGSISQRKSDGIWYGSIEVTPDENGKRRRRYVYAGDYRSAVAKLEELKSESADGLQLDRNITVTKWLDYWLPHVHKERIRPSTYKDYGYTCENIARVIGHKKLNELTAADVRRMATSIGRGERRAQKAHIVLNRALKDAVAERIIRHNPCDAVDAPDVQAGDREALTVGQVHTILTYAAKHCNQMEAARWLFAFLTGTRQGETLGLTWDRVELQSGAVDITWQLQSIKRAHGCGDAVEGRRPCGKMHGGRCTDPDWDVPVKFEYKPLHASLALTRPKSESGKRWVPIIEPLRLALSTLHDLDVGANPHNLVFHRVDGRPVDPKDDSEAWHALLRGAGIIGPTDTLPLHSTRHTTATVLRAAGADEQTRMEILGHASAEVTRVYAHADQAKNSAMMDALAVLVPKAL